MDNEDKEYEVIDYKKLGTKGWVMHYRAYDKEPPKEKVNLNNNLLNDNEQSLSS